jgi:hypothetical protein
MTLRTRLLLAFAAVVLIPIALLAFGLRQEMTRRLSQEYQLRVDRVVEIIREDLARESAGIAERLDSLADALANDNRFRLAAVAGVELERAYLLDYAGTAMRLTGLSMLLPDRSFSAAGLSPSSAVWLWTTTFLLVLRAIERSSYRCAMRAESFHQSGRNRMRVTMRRSASSRFGSSRVELRS